MSEKIKAVAAEVLKHSGPPFPAEHDEVAASSMWSRGGPGCPCAVCVKVVGPRMRAEAARRVVEMEAARSAARVRRDAEMAAARLARENERVDDEVVSLAAGLQASLDFEAEQLSGLEECEECDEAEEDEEGFVDASEPDELGALEL